MYRFSGHAASRCRMGCHRQGETSRPCRLPHGNNRLLSQKLQGSPLNTIIPKDVTFRKSYDVFIIGAGVSGLIAAIQAAQRGRRTLILDHAITAGNKMRISGGGKCNITNRHVSVADYFGADTSFCKYALKRFPTASILKLLDTAHIATEEREYGRIFCKKEATEIVMYLRLTAELAGVHFMMGAFVTDIKYKTGKFVIEINVEELLSTATAGQPAPEPQNRLLSAKSLLIASGGLAYPQVGASDFGYSIAKQFGHTILPLRPALVGFILPPSSPLRNLQGISLDVQIQIKGTTIAEPFLFTHQGISGPASLQASCLWEPGDTLIVNFLPTDDIIAQMHVPQNGRFLVKNLITRLLPERLAKALIPEHLADRKVAELSKQDRKNIAGAIHAYPIDPVAVDDYTKAEATMGGVSTHELNPKSMESRLQKGLFFSGEVVDVAGRLGGYNIHWAFASGFVAGKNLHE